MATKLITALDVKDFNEAKSIVKELSPLVEYFKVGSILYAEAGNKIIEAIHEMGGKVFLDLKFFDIPNTVKGVCSVVTKLGVELFTLHLLGGREMVKGALDGIKESLANSTSGIKPIALGVTVLTSMNETVLQNELKIPLNVGDMVKHLAKMGFGEGLRGFVCSPHEIEILRKELGKEAILVTPGVRMQDDAAGDQKRVMTPARARELGSDFIVMGRPILEKDNRKAAVEKILKELE